MPTLRAALAALAIMAAPIPASAAQVCAWIVETVEEDDLRRLALWLEAGSDVELYYMMKGEGLKSEGSRSHSPSSATYSLRAGDPARIWGFGATLTPPGEIDVIAELHASPKDIFAEEEPPLVMSFAFRREIPEGETTPPETLAARQCQTGEFPKSR
ncbi:hypothetical protein [uncultured Phenylobacterium sp.]|uniref:hypothetical protein n=1 Tax=uncultured Phenylobacterium sp. TaxID=349273 RepID=UPI0025E51423|nr:hypothetical protein [uncultured Phenylobacterium sp.]